MNSDATLFPKHESQFQVYRHVEKIATNSLLLQATAYLGGHYLALLAGSASLNPLSLGIAGATFMFTKQSLFYLTEHSCPDLCKNHKTLRNVIKLGLSLNAFCVAATAYIILAPLSFKALMIANLSLCAISVISVWAARYQQNKITASTNIDL